MAITKIKYGFEFEDGKTFVYEVNLDSETYKMIPGPGPSSKAQWTDLGYQQCENCPLSVSDCAKCPVAENLHNLVEATKNKISYEKAKVIVQTQARNYTKNTSLQEGLLSLFGVIMATSGCPHLDFLRPLVRFHLPFAKVEETLFRAISIYLLKEYLMEKSMGKKMDTKLTALSKNYEEVELVNIGIIGRINKCTKGDADKNAIVALNIFAQMFACEFSNNFDGLKNLFDDLELDKSA